MKYCPAIHQDIFIGCSKMIISRDYYEKMYDYFHPRVHDFIRAYVGSDEDLIMVPPYHGCDLKNKSGTNKLIDYRNGEL